MSGPTKRRSAAGLVELSHRLVERDAHILELLSIVRMATTPQIEAVVFTDGSSLTRARRARHSLAKLHDYGLVARLDRRIGGVRAGSNGYVYRLAPAGKRLLGLPADSGWREPSFAFVDHTLAVVDVHVGLVTQARVGVVEDLSIVHEPDCWRAFSQAMGARVVLKPDLFIQFARGAYELPWFVEVDRDTAHRPALEVKCRLYLSYLRTGIEQRRSGVFPRVLFSVPTQARAEVMRDLVESLPAPADQLFEVATTSETITRLVASEGGDR